MAYWIIRSPTTHALFNDVTSSLPGRWVGFPLGSVFTSSVYTVLAIVWCGIQQRDIGKNTGHFLLTSASFTSLDFGFAAFSVCYTFSKELTRFTWVLSAFSFPQNFQNFLCMFKDKNWCLGIAGGTYAALNLGFYFIKQHNFPLSSEAAWKMLPRVSISYKSVELQARF